MYQEAEEEEEMILTAEIIYVLVENPILVILPFSHILKSNIMVERQDRLSNQKLKVHLKEVDLVK